MMVPWQVSRSTTAAHRRGPVKVPVQPEELVGGDRDGVLFLPLGQDLQEKLGTAPAGKARASIRQSMNRSGRYHGRDHGRLRYFPAVTIYP